MDRVMILYTYLTSSFFLINSFRVAVRSTSLKVSRAIKLKTMNVVIPI